MRSRLRFILLQLAFLLFAAAAPTWAAFEVPDAPSRFFYDGTGAIVPADRRAIEDSLMAFDRRGLQIGVCVMRSLRGESLEQATLAIAENWAPGNSDRDDGVVVAVFLDDRKIRIEVGYGLEARITDAAAGRIIRNKMAPAFREGEYGAGIRRAITAIAALAEGRDIPPREDKLPLVVIVFVLLFFLLIIMLIVYSARKHKGVWIDSGGWGTDVRPRGRSTWNTGGWKGSGGGFGGGGFSGGSFGGGSFGGGGSSGGW